MIDWGNILYQESSTASSDMNVINDIYKKASKFRYGVPVLNDFHTEGLEDISFMIKNYHFLSPDQVVKHNGGICYDHANYIRNELEKNKVKYRFIFIQIYSHGNGVLFHGFIIAYPNDYEGSVYIETAAGNSNGIFKEKDDNTVIKRVFNMMDKTLKSFANKNDIKIDHDAIDITNCIPKPGTSYMEFYENAYNKGKMIHSEIKQKEEYEKQKSVQIQESVAHGEMIKVENFEPNKVYFGSPNRIENPMKINRPLFVSPYPGIASIFAVRPQNLSEFGVPRGAVVNLGYDEWNGAYIDTLLKKPLREVHVRIEGVPDLTPSESMRHGFIYEIDVTDLKDNLYRNPWMSNEFELLIADVDSVEFSNIIEGNK